MDEQRRYTEEEILEIFGSAATEREVDTVARSGGTGLTLAQLQEIGAEIGLPPERVAEAAHGLDLRAGSDPPPRWFGVPVRVRQAVELPRAPTDHEWEMLVAEFRSVFGAPGRVSVTGQLREWSNGHLHACIEPTEWGYRLRLGSYKGSVREVAGAGVALLSVSGFMVTAMALKDKLATGFVVPLFLGVAGAGMLLSAALGTHRWARTRNRQMAYLAARAQELCRGGAAPGQAGTALPPAREP